MEIKLLKSPDKDWDKKVEFKTVRDYNGYRKVYYRIVPSELSWWQNLFSNPWTPMYRCLNYCAAIFDSFDIEEYHKFIFPLKTYGDVVGYLNEQARRYEEYAAKEEVERQEKIARGEEWPD